MTLLPQNFGSLGLSSFYFLEITKQLKYNIFGKVLQSCTRQPLSAVVLAGRTGQILEEKLINQECKKSWL